MKLLLTSAGFLNPKVAEVFLGLFKVPADQLHILFVPTASRTPEELHYVEESRKELIDLGIRRITTFHLDHKVLKNELDGADAIYVCGGNTFYLLHKIRESGLDQVLPNFNGVYVGVSAGSIVVGPNIEVAAPWDKNDVQLSNFTGLRLVNFSVVPHYTSKDQATVQALARAATYEVLALTDKQAVLVV